jgi:hypothetical protein
VRHFGFFLLITALPTAAAVPTPQGELTDPHSLGSAANANAAPVPKFEHDPFPVG